MILSIILLVIVVLIVAILLMFLFYILFPSIHNQNKIKENPILAFIPCEVGDMQLSGPFLYHFTESV